MWRAIFARPYAGAGVGAGVGAGAGAGAEVEWATGGGHAYDTVYVARAMTSAVATWPQAVRPEKYCSPRHASQSVV